MSQVYQIVTDRIIEQLEKGTVPWRRPWGGRAAMPRNLVSGKAYRGVNVFLLGCNGYESPFWLTFKQAKALGGSVRKGEKGSPIIFWKQWERESADGDIDKIPVLRYYTGFHVSQCDGIPADKIPPIEQPAHDFAPIDRCERVVRGYGGRPTIRHEFARAFYRPNDDLVGMPRQTAFTSPEEYYSTLFHELTHSTGHAKRLNRKEIDTAVSFGSQDYGREELVAEMGAAFLCGVCGIETATLDNSAAYVAGWLKAIKRDTKLVVLAAAAAQRAADLILGVQWNQPSAAAA
ncbi:MAG: zincin-like metallopeptidase domain-containing protein [Pirellulaceae bacterium]